MIVAARNRERGEAAVASLSELTGKGENVQFIQLDLADLASIRSFSEKFAFFLSILYLAQSPNF